MMDCRTGSVCYWVGFVGDAVSLLFHTPADVISQRVMVAAHARSGAPEPVRYWATSDVIHDIVKHEGAFKGFYRGFWGSLATYAPSSAIWFASYESSKQLLHEARPWLYPLMHWKSRPRGTCCCCAAGCARSCLLHWGGVVQPCRGGAPGSGWRRVAHHGALDGWRLRGCDVNAVDQPFGRCPHPPSNHGPEQPAGGAVCEVRCGCCCGNALGDPNRNGAGGLALRSTTRRLVRRCRRGFWYILLWTFRTEGLTGLYRGFMPRLWFSVVGSSLTFAGYELAKQMALIPDGIEDAPLLG